MYFMVHLIFVAYNYIEQHKNQSKLIHPATLVLKSKDVSGSSKIIFPESPDPYGDSKIIFHRSPDVSGDSRKNIF